MTFHLEYKDKKFSLITEEKLPTTTKLQIKFFGFNPKDESNFNFESKKNDINIEELIKFFKDNSYSYTLCDNTQKILNDKSEKDISFKEKIKKLEEIRDNINNLNFLNFYKKIDFLQRELKDHQKKKSFSLIQLRLCCKFFCSWEWKNFCGFGFL